MVWKGFGHGYTTANPLDPFMNLGDELHDPPFNVRICGLLWRRAGTVGQKHFTSGLAWPWIPILLFRTAATQMPLSGIYTSFEASNSGHLKLNTVDIRLSLHFELSAMAAHTATKSFTRLVSQVAAAPARMPTFLVIIPDKPGTISRRLAVRP